MSETTTMAAGIDTGKRTLEVALHGAAEGVTIDNDDAGHARLSHWLRERGVVRVGIEASGGYERKVVRRLRADGFAVIRFQPRQVKAYGVFRLQRAKNDRIDAALIAACTAETPHMRAAPDPRLEALAEHLTLIEQIEEDIARYKTRREAVHDSALSVRLEREIVRLKAWRTVELKELALALRQHPDLARRLALAESVEGVGHRTALGFVVRLPELGRLSREQIAALVGLAPYDDDSATRHGARHIAGGRRRVRKTAYAAALPAAFHWNPALQDLYQRLRAKGKPHKLALVACARKLLTYVNAVIERDTPWVPTTQPR